MPNYNLINQLKSGISYGSQKDECIVGETKIPYNIYTTIITLLRETRIISEDEMIDLYFYQNKHILGKRDKAYERVSDLESEVCECERNNEDMAETIEELKGKLDNVRDYTDSIIDECDY